MSDRLIQQGGSLFGVRFGPQTQYGLLDIDRNSAYHPCREPLAIGRMMAALEPLGLVRSLICTSSYSGGLHLYFPFTVPQSSWELAIAVSALLEAAGFKLSPGQLELFPNPKPYRIEGTPSLFNAHRLPMQAGSYLVNSAFQPVWSNPERFVSDWQTVSAQNTLDVAVLKRIIKQVKRRCYQVSGKADKFINDLNAEIELGWTGAGQTNYLLGRITMRAYIFSHVLTGGSPLEGKALVAEIVSTAQALPGYKDWCQHQHELEHRATEWANCIENSHYFHYGDAKGRYKNKLESTDLKPAVAELPSWNQQQAESARARIKTAIAALLDQNALPVRPTARFKALVQAGIGGGSLYRHRDLWHPEYFDQTEFSDLLDSPDQIDQAIHNIADQPEQSQTDIVRQDQSHTSLLYRAGGNRLMVEGCGDLDVNSEAIGGNNLEITVTAQDWAAAQAAAIEEARAEVGTNLQVNAQLHALAQREPQCEPQSKPQCEPQLEFQIQPLLRARQQFCPEAHLARRQRYLDSGDPILVAEALTWSVTQ